MRELLREARRTLVGARSAPDGEPAVSNQQLAYGSLWLPQTERDAMELIFNDRDPEVFESSGRKHAEETLCPLLQPEDTVLDLGCGIGRVAKYVAGCCGTLWAVDASERMLELAREHLQGISNVQFSLCRGTTVPALATGSVDMAYSILTLQHLEKEDAFQLLREVRRVLHPGGKAYFTFPNLLSDEYLTSFLEYADKGEVRNPARARFYTPEEVERLVPAAGFEITRLAKGVEIEATCRV
jgi:ubiquinone/menaquinone biosynthesis C-methylase UbiE